jgi:hypothetical protein
MARYCGRGINALSRMASQLRYFSCEDTDVHTMTKAGEGSSFNGNQFLFEKSLGLLILVY